MEPTLGSVFGAFSSRASTADEVVDLFDAAGQGTIVETGWSPVSKAYEFENQWGEESGSEALAVYAGAVRHDPSQGIVVVLMAKIRTGKDGYYPTPTRAGSVRVVGAVGERLRLMATSGAQFVFDVPTRQY